MTLDADALSETQQEALREEGLEIEGIEPGNSSGAENGRDEENVAPKK